MFLRSLLVQASWNFGRMQNLGFFFVLFPALKRRFADRPGELAAASLRHLQHFNTHPYYAGLVAGTVAREEVDGAGEALVSGIKRSLMCSLGGIGDEFFWAHLKPLTALVALAALAGAGGGAPWAPVVLLALYNVPHLAARWWGVSTALASGREIVAILQTRRLTRWIAPAALAVAAAAGFTAVAFSAHGPWALAAGRAPSIAAAAGVFLALLVAQVRGASFALLLGGLSVLAVAAGFAETVLAP
jgi:PTS system mannose-specific IID component